LPANFAMPLPVSSAGAGDDAAAPGANPLAARAAAGPGARDAEGWLADLRREPLLASLTADGAIAGAAAAGHGHIDTAADRVDGAWIARRGQRGFSTGSGNNRHQPGNPDMRTGPQLDVGRPVTQPEEPEKSRVSAQFHPLNSCRAITIRWIWFVPS
jgi:hypothetical protein